MIRDALGDLLDGFTLTALIAVAFCTIYYGIRVAKELRRSAGQLKDLRPGRSPG